MRCRGALVGWVSLATILVAGTSLLAEADKKPAEQQVATLEDFYGDTGTRFQAAVSFYNREPRASTISPNVSGYGMGIDDMFISWKESRLDEDVTDCATGECADLEVKSTLSYEATGFVELTVVDKTPYDPIDPRNDCNGNGSYADAGDDQDCNDNGVSDVTVKLTSLDETSGEIAILDRVSVSSPAYKGNFPYSTLYDSPGSLFSQASGTSSPVIVATYEDRNDGTGSRCRNALAPEQQGFLQARTTVSAVAGRVDFKFATISLVPSTPGDDDGFADAGETLDMHVTFINKSGLDLDDLVVGLATTDSTIECISVPVVAAGSVSKGATFTTPPFRFKVAGPPLVNRTTVDQTLQASFMITLRSNKFDSLSRATEFHLDLDLNAAGSSAVSPFIEDFESGSGLGLFTLQTLDAGKNSLSLSDGMRCQYNDPFGINSNSPNRVDCFLGFTGDPAAGVNDWHIQRANAANCNSGRAYTGVQSLRWGTCPSGISTPVRDTTRLKQLDAVVTIDPINLPVTNAAPELSFLHQVSLIDNRNIVSIDGGEATDRGIVQAQLADLDGNPVGNWIKLTAYENNYDQQGTDDFTNCAFDPVDDGNNEGDFFDPNDPFRRLGPSSTCFPEFVFARAGHTDWRLNFNPANIGLAGDGPGLEGNQAAGFRNPGTWVEPKFDLIPYAGRRIRLRFLATSLELGTSQLWDELFAVDNVVGDDGWFIDHIRIDQALAEPVVLSVDTASFTGPPCVPCTQGTVVLAVSPTPPLAGPGQIVTLDASGSSLDACNNGVLQYQFWIDANLNGTAGDAGDTLLRDWTDGATFLDAPSATTRYGARVRCSTASGCGAGSVLDVAVTCPASGSAKGPFGQSILVDRTKVGWPLPATVDLVRGNLIALRASGGNFTGSVAACLGDNVTASQVPDALDPSAGAAFYYLVRPTTVSFCNETPGYTTNDYREIPGRDAELDADGSSCP